MIFFDRHKLKKKIKWEKLAFDKYKASLGKHKVVIQYMICNYSELISCRFHREDGSYTSKPYTIDPYTIKKDITKYLVNMEYARLIKIKAETENNHKTKIYNQNTRQLKKFYKLMDKISGK